MRGLGVAAVALCVLASACGGGDPPPDEPDSPDPPPPVQPPVDAGCTPELPAGISLSENFQGFVTGCSTRNGLTMDIKNISAVVVRVGYGPGQQTAADVTPRPQPTVANLVARNLVPSALCDRSTCSVPPGSTVRIQGPRAVRTSLQFDPTASAAAVFSRVIADRVSSRLTSPAQRTAARVTACAQGVEGTLQGARWEVAFRDAITSAPTCKGLIDDIVGTDPAAKERYANQVIREARDLSSGTWVDALLYGGKAVLSGAR